jgi:hypothetical protein
MHLTVDIPDELAGAITRPDEDPSRTALEALGIEAYRRRRLSAWQLRNLLGIATRWELDAFLQERQVESYTAEDFDKDWAVIQESRKKSESPA